MFLAAMARLKQYSMERVLPELLAFVRRTGIVKSQANNTQTQSVHQVFIISFQMRLP